MWAIRQAGIFVVDLAQNERLAFDIIWPNARKRDRIAFEVGPCRDSTQITEQRELIRSPVWYWPFVVLLSPVIYLWRLVVIRSQILDDLRALKFWMEVMLSNKANADR
ncbi:MAG: hypothetical protein MN733_31600 [Nitrososphaera sp.]|nr:hypothetical protein [Nitrososphaera sp.]